MKFRAAAGVLSTALMLFTFSAGGQVAAQPAGQTIRIIYPFAAGGQGDALVRLLADQIQKATGNTTIVENRTGAGGRIGVRAVRDAAPDGTTLLYTAFAVISLYPHFYGDKLEYDPFKDFAPLSQPATFDFALAVGPQVPSASVKDLVAWLKADEKRATYGTPATGNLPHFLGLAFGRATGVNMQVLPYRGSAPAVNDLAAGQLPMAVVGTGDAAPLHNAGKVKIIGTFSKERTWQARDVPTMRELGVDVVGYGWYGMYAPAKTPPDIVARLSKIVVDSVREPSMRERIQKIGLDPTGTTPEELGKIQRDDYDYWGPIIKASGFKPEQ